MLDIHSDGKNDDDNDDNDQLIYLDVKTVSVLF